MARSPNYDPARHGTGWPSNQPSNAIVNYLNNEYVSDEQRLQVFRDNSDSNYTIVPPPSLGGSTIAVTPQPAVIERGYSIITVKLINWNTGITPEIYRRIMNIEDPQLAYDIPTDSITMNPAPTITNSIVSEFTELPNDNFTGIFGVQDI